jgi:hypothetical protein
MIAILGTAALAITTFLVPMQLAQGARVSSGSQQLLPDIRPEKSTLADNDLVLDPQTGHILLRFAGGISNYGSGTLEVIGVRESADSNTLTAYQRIYKIDGSYSQVPVGTLIYHEAHHHWHFVNAVEYRLVDPDTKKGSVVILAQKQAFCLADVAVVDETAPNYPIQPIYNRCYNMPAGVTDFVLMGVSQGWEDIYGKDLVGQSMDVTELMQKPAKTYILQEITNPAGVLKDVHNGTPQTTSVEVTIGQGVPVDTGVARPGV